MKQPHIVETRFSSPRELCEVLVADHWDHPVVFRNPFGPELFGGTDALAAALRARTERKLPWGVYTDRATAGTPLGKLPHDDRHWYTDADASLRDYVDRIARHYGSDTALVITDELQCLGESLWFSCTQFLEHLYGALGGLPFQETKAFMFAGKYGTTPFGFHKDYDINVTCIVEGRKRYLVWPYDPVAAELGVSEADRYEFKSYATLDPATLKTAPTVIEARAGDIVYWPYDAWHQIEADGEFSVSVNMGAPPFASPTSWLGTQFDALARTSAYSPLEIGEQPEQVGPLVDSVRQALGNVVLTDALGEALLRRRTRLGFAEPIPLRDPDVVLQSDDRIRPHRPGILAWVARSTDVFVSANGHGFSCAGIGRLDELLEELNRGASLEVANLERRFCGDDGIARESLHRVLAMLVRIRALTLKPDARERAA